MRRLVLDRDGYRCRTCGRAGRLEVDHVRPIHRGGDMYDLSNLQVLCVRCHIDKTRAERLTGYIRGKGQRRWDALVDELLTVV